MGVASGVASVAASPDGRASGDADLREVRLRASVVAPLAEGSTAPHAVDSTAVVAVDSTVVAEGPTVVDTAVVGTAAAADTGNRGPIWIL
jgi:hypothetical protein